MNEYISFRTAHGIDDKSYTDLYLGDYFKIQDGTYNLTWMVAHFDYYYNKGPSTAISNRGVLLIPISSSIASSMASTDSTAGGYNSSIAHSTTLPAIAAALTTVLGSYLASNKHLLSIGINANIPSMAGLGWSGASSSGDWVTAQCILPNEVQIYGTTVYSSSALDVEEACSKLAVFNFISFTHYQRLDVWLRSVASSSQYCRASAHGFASTGQPSVSSPIRPLIYIT